MTPSKILKGYGYWDTTNYPIGGKFCRACEDIPVHTVAALRTTYKGADFTAVTTDGRFVAFAKSSSS